MEARSVVRRGASTWLWVVVLSLSGPVWPVSGASGSQEIIPDANTVILEHFNGTAAGTVFGPLGFTEGMAGLDQAGQFGPGVYLRYALTPLSEGTLEMWIKPDLIATEQTGLLNFNWYNVGSYPGSGHIMHWTIDGRRGYALVFGVWGYLEGLTGTSTIPADQWTHIAVSWGASGSKLYVNGRIEATTGTTLQPSFGDPTFAYLNYWGGPDGRMGIFRGLIDEFQISSIQRTDAGIMSHATILDPSQITVNTTSDADDFGGLRGVYDLPGPDGVVSLREAITAANNTSGPQTIAFQIPTDDPGFGGAVFTIRPETNPLPSITGDGTTIDGATQTAFAGDTNPSGPEIVLDGSLVSNTDSGGNGLRLDGSSSQINSLVVQSFNLFPGPDRCCSVGIMSTGNDNRIAKSFVGTDPTGTRAMGNAIGLAVWADGSRNVVEGNLVSGNTHSGVSLCCGMDNVVRANLIGTDVAGTQAMGNANWGVFSGSANLVGGVSPEDRNLISGNQTGVNIAGQGTRVFGNYIGTAVDGHTLLGNDAFGVIVEAENTRASIGGRGPGEGNTIAFNGHGVLVQPHYVSELTNVTITVSGNSIYSNGLLGIDFKEDGPSPNDPGDGDAGVNALMNYPILSAVTWSPSQVLVQGSIDTPNPETVTIELFANPPAVGSDPSGHGEGAVFLGTAAPDAFGTFVATLPPLDLGTSISATATDADGNTSEFSQNAALVPLAVTQTLPRQIANPDARVTVAFNTSIDPNTLDASVMSVSGSASGEVAGTVSYDDQTRSISFFPSAAFQAGETIEVRVSGNLRSAGGLGLDGNGNGAPEDSPVDDYFFSFPVQQSLVMTAYPTSATPVLDGQIGPGEYDDAIPVRVVFGEPTIAPGIVPNGIPVPTDEADMSYTAHLLYTPTDLYVAVEVADDRAQDDPDADPVWWDDSVELRPDGDRVANDIALGQPNAEGAVIIVDIGGSTEGGSIGLEHGSQWFAATSRHAGGWIAEFRVPLSSIDTEDGPGITPAGAGSTIGWNMVNGDDDNGGAPYEYPDDSYGAWTGSYGNWYHARETDWGRLFFSPVPARIEALTGAWDVTLGRSDQVHSQVRSGGDVRIHEGSKQQPGLLDGSIEAAGEVRLDAHNHITGDVAAGGQVRLPGRNQAATVQIDGTVSAFAEVGPVLLPALGLAVDPSGASRVHIKKGERGDLPPYEQAGRPYGELKVEQRATLTLHSGTYYFERFTVHHHAEVVLDLSHGPVTLNIEEGLHMGHHTRVTLQGGDAGDVLFNVVGPGLTHAEPREDEDPDEWASQDRQGRRDSTPNLAIRILHNVQFAGTIYAPQGKVRLGHHSQMQGAVLARQVRLFQQVVFEGQVARHLDLSGLSGLSKPVADAAEELPQGVALQPNYPNPFNPSTQIRYRLPESQHVTLVIYDVLGQQVATLVDGRQEAGSYSVAWDAGGMSAGVYFCKLSAGEYARTRRMVLVK
jgi:cytoskeletal protein CcmA (bactofilin family)